MIRRYEYKQPFEVDYQFDDTELDFGVDNTKLKEQYVVSSSYLNNLDLDFNKNSNLEPTEISNVSVNAGWAEFTDNTIPILKYNRDGNFAIQKGTMRCKYKSSFTGNPPKNLYLFGVINNTSNVNTVTLGWLASGKPTIYINNALGTDYRIIPADNILTATTGQEIDFEMYWDLDAGIIRIFVDGVLFFSVNNVVMTRNENATLIMLGNLWAENQYFYGSITDFQIFDRVLHTEDFTPEKKTLYVKDVAKILSNEIFRTDEVISIEAGLTEIAGEAELKAVLVKDGIKIWYDTVAGQMSLSDGSWTQSNTLSEFQQHLIGETTPGNSQIEILVKSYNGDKTPILEYVEIVYSYSASDTIKEYAEIEVDPAENPEFANNNMSITWELISSRYKYKSSPIVNAFGEFVYNESSKKLSGNLLKTEDMETGAFYIFRIYTKTKDNKNKISIYKKTIPNSFEYGSIYDLPDV